MKRKNNGGERVFHLLTPLSQGIRRDPLRSGAVLITFAVLLFLLLFSREIGAPAGFNPQDFQVGKVAERDLVVDRDIAYDDREATRLKRDAEALLVSPVFIKEPQISARAREHYRTFSLNFQVLLRQGASPAALFLQIQSLLPGFFTQEIITSLVGEDEIYKIIPQGEELLYQYLEVGVFHLPRGNELVQPEVELWQSRNGATTRQKIPSKGLITLGNYGDDLDARAEEGEFPLEWLPSLKQLLSVFLEENTFYDDIETEDKRQAARDAVDPVTRLLLEGERIIQKGSIVTETDMMKVNALGSYTSAATSFNFMGTLLMVVILFILGALFLSPPLSSKYLKRSEVMLFLGFLVFFFSVAFFIIRVFDPSTYPLSLFLPSSMVSMMIAIIISPQAGVFITIFYSLGYLLQTGMDSYGFLFAFITGTMGALTVINAEKRSSLIRSSILLAGVGGFVLLGVGFLERQSAQMLFTFFGLGFLNGLVCGILTLGLLPFIEHMLNSATAFRLRELSDLNTPLFKRMLVLAPGTYSHSISVANLAESAAREIGANGLLARVGAYYHDIGKIEQAEYFAENQTAGNKHDDLKASLSTTVIKSHVKIGVEKAKELALPQEVIDIVSQHHGSGLISYFYIQALKEQEGNSQIKREDFSYTGVPPMSREAAIVMLADSVEAASRTLEKPNIAKLEKFVWDIIMSRIKDAQMSRCELTFKDMETIKKTFVQILAGYFHTRVEYPDEKEAVQIITGGRKSNR